MTNSTNLGLPSASAWFSFPKPNPAAKVRLFCFPYAGSGANIFYKWHASLPDEVELCLVNLPGRDLRLKEKPFDRMSKLMQAIEYPLLPFLDKPVALFGHSMGALICYELSRHLRRRYGAQPAHLFISGCGSQRSLSAENLPALKTFEGAAETALNKATFLQLMLPTLKADLALCETYSHTTETPLDCAISVYGGLEDCMVKPEALEAWREETTGPFALHLFDDGHFFIQSNEALVLKALSEELRHMACDVR